MEKDLYTCAWGEIVDLNDKSLYSAEKADSDYTWYGTTNNELWDLCIKEIGYVYMYTHYLHPRYEAQQWPTIEKMLEEFAANERDMRFRGEEGRLWLCKWLFKLRDYTENMC